LRDAFFRRVPIFPLGRGPAPKYPFFPPRHMVTQVFSPPHDLQFPFFVPPRRANTFLFPSRVRVLLPSSLMQDPILQPFSRMIYLCQPAENFIKFLIYPPPKRSILVFFLLPPAISSIPPPSPFFYFWISKYSPSVCTLSFSLFLNAPNVASPLSPPTTFTRYYFTFKPSSRCSSIATSRGYKGGASWAPKSWISPRVEGTISSPPLLVQ